MKILIVILFLLIPNKRIYENESAIILRINEAGTYELIDQGDLTTLKGYDIDDPGIKLLHVSQNGKITDMDKRDLRALRKVINKGHDQYR